MNTQLPAGCQVRPATIDDLESIVSLLNIEHCWLHGTNGFDINELRIEWQSPNFHLPTDTQIVIQPDGQPIAYGEFWERPPHVAYYGFASVHPEHHGRGLGSFLAGWLETRACESIAKAPEGARCVMQQHVESNHIHACELLKQAGYKNVRNSYRMCIDFNGPPAQVEAPEGMIIRPIANEEEERQAVYTAHEAFQDHWGFVVDEPAEEAYKRRKYFIDNDPLHDPSLWFIALDGDEVAGVSMCYPYLEEDKDMGWVSQLGVRRAWRKRGLGLALLAHSFQEFYKRGKPRVGLGVDASSLTGATRLYEKAGMRVIRNYHGFELELRPGKDLTRQTLEE